MTKARRSAAWRAITTGVASVSPIAQPKRETRSAPTSRTRRTRRGPRATCAPTRIPSAPSSRFQQLRRARPWTPRTRRAWTRPRRTRATQREPGRPPAARARGWASRPRAGAPPSERRPGAHASTRSKRQAPGRLRCSAARRRVRSPSVRPASGCGCTALACGPRLPESVLSRLRPEGRWDSLYSAGPAACGKPQPPCQRITTAGRR
mmetsp:Transcript_46259/g.123669  ORF Transcript_46259/g.123669 Transcript_46259/m.123669 type:complete len:207 (+) Transcript_46259:532-1152(+)